MHAMVDHDRCQGHARCVLEAPGLFDLDTVDSHAYVLADPVPPELAAAARAAAADCPEQAVSITG